MKACIAHTAHITPAHRAHSRWRPYTALLLSGASGDVLPDDEVQLRSSRALRHESSSARRSSAVWCGSSQRHLLRCKNTAAGSGRGV